jgi:hypothetical protein
VAEEDVRIDMQRKRWDTGSEYRLKWHLIAAIPAMALYRL